MMSKKVYILPAIQICKNVWPQNVFGLLSRIGITQINLHSITKYQNK